MVPFAVSVPLGVFIALSGKSASPNFGTCTAVSTIFEIMQPTRIPRQVFHTKWYFKYNRSGFSRGDVTYIGNYLTQPIKGIIIM